MILTNDAEPRQTYAMSGEQIVAIPICTQLKEDYKRLVIRKLSILKTVLLFAFTKKDFARSVGLPWHVQCT